MERRGAAAEALSEGLVVSCHRRHFVVRQDAGEIVDCVLKGRSMTLACGDHVRFAPVAGGGAIESVLPRVSLFYRSDAFKEKLIAANVTQIVGVVAPGLSLDLELVDRWSVAAETERCRFVLAANKSDLPGFDELLARLEPYTRLGYASLRCRRSATAAPLVPWLEGQHTVLIGQSGMGKSTILNAVAPDAACKDGRRLGCARNGPPHDVAFDAARAAR